MALTPLQHRNKIANLMLHLKCTEAEAEDIIAYDEAVDKGEPTKYDLTAEQMKATKEYRITGTREKKPTTYEFTQRERKANPTKQAIIAELAETIKASTKNAYDNVVITGKERSIDLKIGDTEFTLTLTQHRPKKS